MNGNPEIRNVVTSNATSYDNWVDNAYAVTPRKNSKIVTAEKMSVSEAKSFLTRNNAHRVHDVRQVQVEPAHLEGIVTVTDVDGSKYLARGDDSQLTRIGDYLPEDIVKTEAKQESLAKKVIGKVLSFPVNHPNLTAAATVALYVLASADNVSADDGNVLDPNLNIENDVLVNFGYIASAGGDNMLGASLKIDSGLLGIYVDGAKGKQSGIEMNEFSFATGFNWTPGKFAISANIVDFNIENWGDGTPLDKAYDFKSGLSVRYFGDDFRFGLNFGKSWDGKFTLDGSDDEFKFREEVFNVALQYMFNDKIGIGFDKDISQRIMEGHEGTIDLTSGYLIGEHLGVIDQMTVGPYKGQIKDMANNTSDVSGLAGMLFFDLGGGNGLRIYANDPKGRGFTAGIGYIFHGKNKE